MDLKEEALLGPDFAEGWYHASKARAVLQLLGGVRVDELLDVGAGSGVFSRALLEAGVARRAVCVDPNYEAERTESFPGGELRFVREAGAAAPGLCLFLDVLEHVDDDEALLSRHAGRLPPGGLALISVPAFQWLWSGHDVFLEHRRRYSLRQLEELVRRCGLVPLRGRYFFGLVLPGVAALRLLDRLRLAGGRAEPRSQLRRLPAPAEWFLRRLHDLERRTLLPFNRLGGVTAFCLARSPPAGPDVKPAGAR